MSPDIPGLAAQREEKVSALSSGRAKKAVLCSLGFFSVIHLWQQFVSYKFEMLICVTATMSSGENEVVVYVFLHRVPHASFGQKNGKENGEGKKKKRMYRCTYKFDFIRTLVKCFDRENGIFFSPKEI